MNPGIILLVLCILLYSLLIIFLKIMPRWFCSQNHSSKCQSIPLWKSFASNSNQIALLRERIKFFGTNPRVRELGEILLIVMWGLFITRNYLNFDPTIFPAGNEFGLAIQENYTWGRLFTCGSCIFWNSNLQGGAPSFGNIYSSWLHPTVTIPTILFGAINGIKLALVINFILAGIGQWWFAKVLKINRFARLWISLLAVSGGHLSTRMELGTAGLVISTVACSLVIPPLVDLLLHPSRKKAIILGLILCQALISGQGYLIFGLVICILPASLSFIFHKSGTRQVFWKEILISFLIAGLGASFMLIPVIHLFPLIQKSTDLTFSSAQPIQYIPLNLIISSPEYYTSNSLQKTGYPFAIGNYIGWIPIIFAVISIRVFNRNKMVLFSFFSISLTLILFTCSTHILKFLAIFSSIPNTIRFPQLIAGLAIPLILGLAGIGMDYLLAKKIPSLQFHLDNGSPLMKIKIPTLLVVVIPMVYALNSTQGYSSYWIRTAQVDPDVTLEIGKLSTATSQWVDVPFTIHSWYIPALEADMKLANGIRPWTIKNKKHPEPQRAISTFQVNQNDPHLISRDNDWYFSIYDENEYAIASHNGKGVPCDAFSTGGIIDIHCPNTAGGALIVFENSWDGWNATVDGKPVNLLQGQWLSVELTPGPHTIQFRYQPWDVWVGMTLSLIGIVLCIWLWRISPPLSEPESIAQNEHLPSADIL